MPSKLSEPEEGSEGEPEPETQDSPEEAATTTDPAPEGPPRYLYRPLDLKILKNLRLLFLIMNLLLLLPWLCLSPVQKGGSPHGNFPNWLELP